jgi:hypothetical protein
LPEPSIEVTQPALLVDEGDDVVAADELGTENQATARVATAAEISTRR